MAVDVVVLEKHADFLRDFRGDTIHPSTLEMMYELGILDEFLKRPHQEVRQLAGQIGSETVTIADFTHLPTHCKFLGLMPQWEFLNFISEQAGRYPGFHLKMQAEATDLLEENGRVAGVRAKTPAGQLEVRADLTVGADGRHSLVRERAGLEVVSLGAPMDVLWMRLSRRATDPGQTPGAVRRRQNPGSPQSRRLLAGRLCNPQRNGRRTSRARTAGPARGTRAAGSISCETAWPN